MFPWLMPSPCTCVEGGESSCSPSSNYPFWGFTLLTKLLNKQISSNVWKNLIYKNEDLKQEIKRWHFGLSAAIHYSIALYHFPFQKLSISSVPNFLSSKIMHLFKNILRIKNIISTTLKQTATWNKRYLLNWNPFWKKENYCNPSGNKE